jgi:hypothetical protein
MSGTTLLSPSNARTITLDPARPIYGIPAWPNKNANDALDYWFDLSGALLDGSDGASASLVAGVLEVVAGDSALIMIGAPQQGSAAPLYAQNGWLMAMLGGGTPNAAYTLMLTAGITGGGITRTYTQQVTIQMTTQQSYTSVLLGPQAAVLLAGVDLSESLVTPTGGTQETLATALASAGGGGTAGVTIDDLTQPAGNTAITASVLTAQWTRSTSASAGTGVRMPLQTLAEPAEGAPPIAGKPFTWVNQTGSMGMFYPPTGLNFTGLAVNQGVPVPSGTVVTGIQFADGVCDIG